MANKSIVLPCSAALRAYCDRTFVLSFFRTFFRLHQRVGKLYGDVISYITRPNVRMLAIHWAALMGHPPGENRGRGVAAIVPTRCGLSGCMFSMTKLIARRLRP